jgi:hypothetical protein
MGRRVDSRSTGTPARRLATATAVVVLALGAGGLAGCGDDDAEGPAEEAGQAVDEAGEDAGEAIEDADQEVGEDEK